MTATRLISTHCRRSRLQQRRSPIWAVRPRARSDFAQGEYRWVAQVANQLVFAEPDNSEARELRCRCTRTARLSGRVGDVAERLSLCRQGITRGGRRIAAATGVERGPS